MVQPGHYAMARDLEPAVIELMRRESPGWQPDMGACPHCVQVALDYLLAQAAIDDAAGLPHAPVYGILPTGLRLGYNRDCTGNGVTIAFLDSGFSDHPDLKGRIKLYVDASQRSVRTAEQVEEAGVLSWHGTMTTVVACGDGLLSDGLYRSLAPEASVVLIKVSSPEGRINEEGIARGLEWVLHHGHQWGVRVVNISLGGDRKPYNTANPVDRLVEALVARDMLVVCASGNAGERSLAPPADAPSALTVGGLDDKNTLDPNAAELWHSNYGQTRGGVWKPELVAPSLWLAAPVLVGSGVDREAAALDLLLRTQPALLPRLLSDPTLMRDVNVPKEIAALPVQEARAMLRGRWQAEKLITPHYQHVDGTSFAAPIVSAVAAQMIQTNPTIRAAGLRDLLMRTARYLPEFAPDQQGHGVVDPYNAVAAAQAVTQL